MFGKYEYSSEHFSFNAHQLRREDGFACCDCNRGHFSI